MTDYYEAKSQPITRVMVWRAYKEVKANRGGSGIDGMTWEELDSDLPRQLYKLWNRLSSGTYFPQPVKRVEIPKAGGEGTRPLGIPTLLDRIAQQVVRKHLEMQLEPKFHANSFGYRPQRGAHQAVAQSHRQSFEHNFALDIDIKGYFDSISHDLLMKALSHYCKDKWVLMYVERWLKAGVMGQQGFESTSRGTPQGGVISPLLANLFLHVVFDKWMDKHHPRKPFERYADDIVVHCKSEQQAKYMLQQLKERFEACSLELHPLKTQIVNLRGKSETRYPRKFDFLGFSIRPVNRKCMKGWHKLPGIFVSAKSKKRMRDKFKRMRIHNWRISLAEVANRLNPIVQGMITYYLHFWEAGTKEVWEQLNRRLLKWVKWQKKLGKHAAVRWLHQQYLLAPKLFVHWKLVQPSLQRS